jgi:hypothetical protein
VPVGAVPFEPGPVGAGMVSWRAACSIDWSTSVLSRLAVAA